jgi:hypothetical protein
MSSIGSSFGQRKQKKMVVIKANVKMWTTVQVLNALKQTTLSGPVFFTGIDSAPVGSIITDKQLGQSAVVNTDADLSIVFGNSGSGLATVGTSLSQIGEALRPLCKKFTIGTKVYGDLVTLQKIQRTDFGTTTTQGVTTTGQTGSNDDNGKTPASDGDGFGTFWIVTESFSSAGGNSTLLISGIGAVAQSGVVSF